MSISSKAHTYWKRDPNGQGGGWVVGGKRRGCRVYFTPRELRKTCLGDALGPHGLRVDVQPVLCSCRSTTEVPAPGRPSGVPLILLPTARQATGVVHRPGKVVVSFRKQYKGPSCTFHAKLLMEASGQPATPGFSEPRASEGGSTWMPGPADKGGPSVTAQRGDLCSLVWMHLYLFFH